MSTCVCRGMVKDCPLCVGTGTPVCSRCGGIKYVAWEKRTGGEQWEAKPCPVCGQTLLPAIIPVNSGLVRAHEAWTFSRLIQVFPVLLEAAEKVKIAVETKRGWVAFLSPSGRGKSFLLVAAANHALARQSSVWYGLTGFLLDELQRAVTGKHTLTYEALQRYYAEVDVLCLDEFGEYNPTPWRQAELRKLLVVRGDPDWLTTILATNRTPNEISRTYPYLWSRLKMSEAYWSILDGVPDLRRGQL